MCANTTPIPIAYFRLIVPVSLGMMILIGIELVLHDFLSLLDRDRDHDLTDGSAPAARE